MQKFITTICIVLVAVLLTNSILTPEVEARQRRGSKKSASTTAKAKKSTSSKTKKRVKRSKRIRVVPMSTLNVILDKEITPGVRRMEYKSDGTFPVHVHVLTFDRTIPGNAVRLVKGEDKADGLERLSAMATRYQEQTGNTLLGIVNANFWRAVRNTAIGPCVVDGEVVEMLPYKKWTSGFFDVQSKLTIDSFQLSGTVRFAGRTLPVSSVNRRVDTLGVAVYNNYSGTTVPSVTTASVEKAFREAVKDSVFADRDSTELALTQEVLRQEIAKAQREASTEFPMMKIRVRYLRGLGVNTKIPCTIMGVEEGECTMPLRGAVISVPKQLYYSGSQAKIGDTLWLEYKTNISPQTRFMNAVCGTPRLMRGGAAQHEAQLEGSTGKRFISGNLARTALGVDRSGNKIVLVAVQASDPEHGTTGATLQQMAKIMALLGCYNAMNLDGGGSSGMVVGNDHVFFDGADPLTRKLSVGLAFVRLTHVLRNTR